MDESYVHLFHFPISNDTFLYSHFNVHFDLHFDISFYFPMSDQHIFPGVSALEHPGRRGAGRPSLGSLRAPFKEVKSFLMDIASDGADSTH